jgi:hypothetical protein
MSYQAVAQLDSDPMFQGRTRSAAIEQAETFKDSARGDFKALAFDVLRGGSNGVLALTRMGAAGPGIGDKVDNGDGTIDQSKVTDADLLSLTQANWPVVASLFWNEDGTPIAT